MPIKYEVKNGEVHPVECCELADREGFIAFDTESEALDFAKTERLIEEDL